MTMHSDRHTKWRIFAIAALVVVFPLDVWQNSCGFISLLTHCSVAPKSAKTCSTCGSTLAKTLPVPERVRRRSGGSLVDTSLPIHERVTIVLVTSPVGSHPSTQLVDEVIASFDRVSGLPDCNMIIVADGAKVRAGKPKWNQGKVDEDAFSRYTEYVHRLRTKYSSGTFENLPGRGARTTTTVVGPLEKRVNFAHALLEGLKQVDTEFVLVVQHDRIFAENIDLVDVLPWMDAHPYLRYIGFQTVDDYPTLALSKFGGWTRWKADDAAQPCLMPLFMWYDSTHICRTRQYVELIDKEVKQGEFIESSYGVRLLEDIKASRDRWSFEFHMENYGLFLYYDPTIRFRAPIVKHINGRSYWSREGRIKNGWPAERPTTEDIMAKQHRWLERVERV